MKSPTHESSKLTAKSVSRRGFLKSILPGVFASTVVLAAQAGKEPAAGTYGNGPYGGAAK